MKPLIIIFFLSFTFVGFSQKVRVLDDETGKPVNNVTLFNIRKTTKSVTNKLGMADISMFKDNEIIIFSHLSYNSYPVTKLFLKNNNYHIYLRRSFQQLDNVVISVFKNTEKVNRIAKQVAVLSLKDIQKVSPQTSADLLATIPGIKVQKSQFGGGSPVLRGMESNRVLLVVDGVRLNNAIYRKGHLQNSITISPNLLEKTEIVFGPSSVIYGSDALGGVIHYYTKDPKTAEKTTLKNQVFTRFSTVNNEVTTSVSTELRLKKMGAFTSFSYSSFGDLRMGKKRLHGFKNWGKVFYYSENTDTYYTATPTVNSNENLQRNTGYSQTDFLQKLFIPLSKKADLKFNIQYSTSSNIPRFDRLMELNSGNLKFAEWYYGPQNRFLFSTQLLLTPRKSWLEKGTITFAYQDINESRVQRKFNSLNRSYRKESVNVYSVNGDFSLTLSNKKSKTLSYGFELAYNKVNSRATGKSINVLGNKIIGFSNTFNIQSRYPDGGSTYFSAAIYTDFRQDIGKKSTLNTGVRITNTRLNANWIDQNFIILPQSSINLQNAAVTATLGYVYKPSGTWQINSVLSSGFRSPNIDDIGRIREKNGNVTVPNINLKPEFAYSAEIGFLKYLNQKRFSIGANVYYTLLNNYITRDNFSLNGTSTMFFDGEAGNIVANQNRDKAYITGLTANYKGKISNKINTEGFVTYTKGRTKDTKEPMSSIPPLFGQFDINYKNNKFIIGGNIRFNSRKKAEDYNISEGIDNIEETPIIDSNTVNETEKYYGTPSWFTVGLNSIYTINKKWELHTRLDNLFDVHYKEFASGISAPGRNFSLSFLANF